MIHILNNPAQNLTTSKGKMFIGSFIVDEQNAPLNGMKTLPDGTIMRFKNGYLDGDGEPALEYENGGVEYWTAGFPHGEPAVIQDFGAREEYWNQGFLLKIISEYEIEKLG